MGSIDRVMSRAFLGVSGPAYGRQPQDSRKSPLSHSQAMILGGFSRHFLLFGSLGLRARKTVMYPESVVAAFAVFAPMRLRVTGLREEP
jgi:hypothetical protein